MLLQIAERKMSGWLGRLQTVHLVPLTKILLYFISPVRTSTCNLFFGPGFDFEIQCCAAHLLVSSSDESRSNGAYAEYALSFVLRRVAYRVVLDRDTPVGCLGSRQQCLGVQSQGLTYIVSASIEDSIKYHATTTK
jgi:hypothetical protein